VIDSIIEKIKLAFVENQKSLLINENLRLFFLPFGVSYTGDLQENNLLIYQDLFETNPAFYRSILSSKLGLNQRLHGRQTKVQVIDKLIFNDFCNEFHYLKTATCHFYYGLFLKDELVMVAGFSKPRLMYREGEKFQSAQLVRLASKYGYTVTGGMTKLIQFYLKNENPDDIVSYIDKDFFDGKSYEKNGFVKYKELDPMLSWLASETKQRFSTNQLIKQKKIDRKAFENADFVPQGFVPIYNQGTLKMVFRNK
jgi:hypothetical protein